MLLSEIGTMTWPAKFKRVRGSRCRAPKYRGACGLCGRTLIWKNRVPHDTPTQPHVCVMTRKAA